MHKKASFWKAFGIECLAAAAALGMMAGSMSASAAQAPAAENAAQESPASGSSIAEKPASENSVTQDTIVKDSASENPAAGDTIIKDTPAVPPATENSSPAEDMTQEETYADEEVSDSDASDNNNEDSAALNEEAEIPEIVNVVVSSSYRLAFNPYRFTLKMGNGRTSTQQIVSLAYGIVNKSSAAQRVKLSLTVEDNSGGELVFVDSAEEALNAGAGVYAVYFAFVPADGGQILIDGKPADIGISAESLRNVEMSGAYERAAALHEGANSAVFELAGAQYSQDGTLTELAPRGAGVTAYTFSGAMNPNAQWEKLSGVVKLTAVYTYEMADAD